MPVSITGLSESPSAGDRFMVFDTEKKAKAIANARMLKFKEAPFEDLGFAKPDLHRGLRQGVPEVIFGEGKTPEQIDKITESLLEGGQETVLITRLSAEKKDQLQIPVKYFDVARRHT